MPSLTEIGVPRTVFGVAITSRRGVIPLKSVSTTGALAPPFKGVSTLVNAAKL